MTREQTVPTNRTFVDDSRSAQLTSDIEHTQAIIDQLEAQAENPELIAFYAKSLRQLEQRARRQR